MGRSKMIEYDILEIKIKNLKKLKNFSAFSAVFFLHTIPINILIIISIIAEMFSDTTIQSTGKSILTLISVLAITALMLWVGMFSCKNNAIYRELLKKLTTVDPTQSETRKIVCQKFKHLLVPRGKHTSKTVGICIYTESEKCYYILNQSKISYGALDAVFRTFMGEQEFEFYKGTNIIKRFDAADEVGNN